MHSCTQFRRCCLNQGGHRPFSAKMATLTLAAKSHAMLTPPVRTVQDNGDTLPSSITYHEQLGKEQSDHYGQLYLLSGGYSIAAAAAEFFPPDDRVQIGSLGGKK